MVTRGIFTVYTFSIYILWISCKMVTSEDSPQKSQNPPPFVNPFNTGNSLFETPYSGSISAMSGGGMNGGGNSFSPLQNVLSGGGGGGRNGVPAMYMSGGKLMMGHQQCLKHIVCPQYCHQMDENGCETCPCGPANGMMPAGISQDTNQNKKEKEPPKKKDNQCIQTLICMLSCKDGYELGKKGKDGCQTCKCVKQNQVPKQTGQYGNEISKKPGQTGNTDTAGGGSESNNGDSNGRSDGSASNGNSGFGFNPLFPGSGMTAGTSDGTSSSSGSSSCAGPFCSGAGMPSPFSGGGSGASTGGMGLGMSPFGLAAGGGGKSFGGASVAKPSGKVKVEPGRDCFGPECSAKNGMKLLAVTKTEEACPSTTLCVKTCKQNLKLGPKGSDGCPSCACVKATDAPATVAPKQSICEPMVKCMLKCTDGYVLGSADQHGCPSCSCKIIETTLPLTTASSYVKSKPSCANIVQLCVNNCHFGYQLVPATVTGACDSCMCLPAPTTRRPTTVKVHHSACEDNVVGCMSTCQNGYLLRASSNGNCPNCRCLPPPSTTMSPTRKPNVYSILHNCPEAIHCMVKCQTGYSLETISGSSCPRCTCNQVPVMALVCSSQLSCPQGCSLGYRNGQNGCPTCVCVRPTEIGVITRTDIYIKAAVKCSAHFSCSKKCSFGYQSGDNSCPTCRCLVPVKTHTHMPGSHICTGAECSTSDHVTSVVDSCTGRSCSSGHRITSSSHTSAGSSNIIVSGTYNNGGHEIGAQTTLSLLVHYCTNVARCVKSCKSGVSLTGTVAGKCPVCTCSAGIPSSYNVNPTGQTAISVSRRPSLHEMCPDTYRCGQKCPKGFTLKNEAGSKCPVCYCITGQIVSLSGSSNHTLHKLMVPAVNTGPSGNTDSQTHAALPVSYGEISTGSGLSKTTGSSAVHTSAIGHFSGAMSHANNVIGQGAPAGSISHRGHLNTNTNCVGPECSAKNGMNKGYSQQTPPNQCAKIIHCVLTCNGGYKLTEKDTNGCPGCHCLHAS